MQFKLKPATGVIVLAVVGILTLMFLLALTPGISFIEDLGRHLLLGQIILETGSVPTTNLLTYTYPDFPFVNHHWLFQCCVFLLHSWLGYNGLIVVKAVVMTMALGLSLGAALDRERKPIGQLLFWGIGLLSAIVLNYRAHIRPEVISFFFVGLLLFVMERHRAAYTKGNTWPGWIARLTMVGVMPVWTNSHIYFVFGLGMLGAYGLERCLSETSWQRLFRETGWLVLAAALCLINPNGLDGLLYPFRILSNYGVDITENHSPFRLWGLAINPMLLALIPLWGLTVVLSVWTLVCRSACAIKGMKADRGCNPPAFDRIASVIIVLAAAGLSLQMARHTALLALAAPPLLLAVRQTRLPGLATSLGSKRLALVAGWALTGGALMVNAFLCFAVAEGSYSRMFAAPIAPTSFGLDDENRYLSLRQLVNEYDLKGPVFSDFNVGSLVEFNLYPQPGYVDNRPEGFPMAFWQEEYHPAMNSPQAWRQVADDRQVNLVALSLWNDQFPLPFDSTTDPAWSLVLLDDFMGVWLRRTQQNAGAISEHGIGPAYVQARVREISREILELQSTSWLYRQVRVESILFRLHGLALAGGGDLVRPYVEQLVRIYPRYRMARAVLAGLSVSGEKLSSSSRPLR